MTALPEIPRDKLTVIAWPDDTLDVTGHDPRSRYVETYWLGILGPSATWLLRHFADELEASPTGFRMDIAETATRLGVGGIGKHSPFIRALGRLMQFELAQLSSSDTFAVRRRLPTLTRRYVKRLPPTLQSRHDFWCKQQLSQVS